MTPNRRRSPEARAQMFDIRLLDLFAEVESLLRTGREMQRDALHMRDVAPTNGTQRRAAMRRMQKRVDQIRKECEPTCSHNNRQHRRREDARETC